MLVQHTCFQARIASFGKEQNLSKTEQCLGEKRSLGIFYDPAQMSFLLPIYKDKKFPIFLI